MASLWEQMVTEENRLLAARLGLRISDVEEQLSLLGTLEESKQASDIAIELSVALQDRVVQSAAPKSSSSPTIEAEEEIGSDIDIQEASSKSKNIISTNYLTRASLPEGSGPWPLLPQVLVDYILFFLGDIDMCGYISIASRSTFVLSEDVYRFLCEITYPRQTSKKICRVQHWKSWKNMIIHRPRLRLNGFYSLRTMYSKCYSNDAFWEEKKFESIEVKYYRHMRFFEDGRVLYSLDTVDPWEIAKLLRPGKIVPKKVYEGRYFLVKNKLRVEVSLHYCEMVFELLLLDGNDGFVGKHNMLTLISHSSIPFHSGGTNGLVSYHIPVFPDFRFHRVWDFYPHHTK